MEIGIIYIARNKSNGKGYVGQTTKMLDERKEQHFYNAYRIKINGDGYMFDFPFAKAIRKYGIDGFNWEIIYTIPKASLNLFEIWTIAKFDTYVGDGKGYNATLGGEISPMNNPETAMKMALSKTGKKLSNEHRKKLSENNTRHFLGQHHSDETKKKISEANGGEDSAWFGRKHTEEEKRKISRSHLGMIFSEEHKKNISKSKTGIKNYNFGKTFSDETRKKMSEAQTREKHSMFGKHHSVATKEKMSKTRKGRHIKLTDEQINTLIYMYNNGRHGIRKKLSIMFDVSVSTIDRIVKKRPV